MGGCLGNRGVIGLVRWFRSLLESDSGKPVKVLLEPEQQFPDKGYVLGSHNSDQGGHGGHQDINPGHSDIDGGAGAKENRSLTGQVDYIRNRAFEYILKDEGFSEKPYWDVSRWSIGHGLPKNGRAQISRSESETEVKEKIEQILHWYAEDYMLLHEYLGPARGVILVCLMYQLGRRGLQNFVDMNREIRKQNWKAAAYEMYNSRWFWQTTKGIYNPANRAQRFVRQMATGKE
ncbi:MAG: hypothetical protein DRP09_14195 [Candidatus Thorarchaeota archaeon]|nr:MAG: hypothetical protein DRP09_14195 [Candidatus Thorarchaeota archaeon]